MNDRQLEWEILERRQLLHTPVYDVIAQKERAEGGRAGEYVAIEAPDWVMTIPVYQGQFVLARQWRHSAERLTTEFPGGVRDGEEDPAQTAYRELYEETGFRAGKLTLLGVCNPNPALFKNTFHVFLAEELVPTGEQHLDDDELLNWELRPIDEVLRAWGSPEFSHALMGTALAFWLLHEKGGCSA